MLLNSKSHIGDKRTHIKSLKESLMIKKKKLPHNVFNYYFKDVLL